MRILLAGPLPSPEMIRREVQTYRAGGHDVVVNNVYLNPEQAALLRESPPADHHVTSCTFDPGDAGAFRDAIIKDAMGYDAIVYPPDLEGFTPEVVKSACDQILQHPLKAVGCPNDVITHLSAVSTFGIPVHNCPDLHKDAVAEYTMSQIAFHARKLPHYYAATGANNQWPHDDATVNTASLAFRTLGVIGVTGRDGLAVALLAKRMRLRVVGIGSGAPARNARARLIGVEIVEQLDDLLRQADFISINSAKNKTLGLIGKHQFAQLKPHVIVINPAGAEIIDKGALFEDLSKAPGERKLGVLVLDMPYGGRRGKQTFSFDPDNARMRELGVLFTPRMAGYTLDTYSRGVGRVADAINGTLLGLSRTTLDERTRSNLRDDIIELAKTGAETAMALKKAGLVVETKADGTICTNADKAVEELIRDGLKARGYECGVTGEELGNEGEPTCNIQVIIDGIDGTRNFRDGNYGWCTSVCVKENGVSVIGVVHDPSFCETFAAVKGQGALRTAEIGTEPIRTPKDRLQDFSFSIGSFRVRGSTAIKNAIVEDIKRIGGRQREWGSVALSICAVARGGLGSFIQGNSTPHDYAAAMLIAEEAGALAWTSASEEGGRQDVIVAHTDLFQQIRDIFCQRVASLPRANR
jgi:fructose-1,6-bisphosphatase/inositol monophosphatase family enzyme/phosphoglycerate dehydrogenase-like enzyme